MTFKKAKLFRFKKDQNERITCISYDDNEEYYSFLREYRSKGYRQVIITTEIMIKIIETSVLNDNLFVYNSNYNIEISPDDKKLKLDAIKGFKGDTDDLQTKVTATGESVMNIISTLSFLLESNNLNQVKVDLNYSKHSNITLTLQKDTVCIDPNSYCGIFETDETSEETISKLYLMVYLEILAQLRQEYYNDIDNEDWNTNVHSNFLQQVGKKLSEKIDEKTQAIMNKKQTITE